MSVTKREVTVWVGSHQLSWARGTVTFIFPTRVRRRRCSRYFLVVSAERVVVMNASSFDENQFRGMRRHLECFMAMDIARRTPRFTHVDTGAVRSSLNG